MYLHLRSLAQFLRDICAACRPPTDDLTAVMDATAEPAYVEPTPLAEEAPLFHAAVDFLRSSLAALDAMEDVGDFLWLCGEDA